MSVYIACDSCEKRLKIPENVVGRPIKCPSCGSVFKADPSKVMPGQPAPHPVIEERQPAAVAPRRAAPAADEDDDILPVRKPAAPEDEDEDLPKPREKAAALDDDEEEIVPAKKKAAVAKDDEDEVRPAKKKAAAVDDDDEDDDRPARRKKPAVADDEDEEEDEDKAKKSKRRTPWYVMLPLLVLSFCGAGLAALWTIGFSYLDMDRGLAHLNNFDTKVWFGVGTAGVITLLCLIVTLIPARSWLRFLLVFLFLGIGYGGSFAAIHWWKDLPLPEEEKPPVQPVPEGGPMGGGRGGPMGGGRGGPPMPPPGGAPVPPQ